MRYTCWRALGTAFATGGGLVVLADTAAQASDDGSSSGLLNETVTNAEGSDESLGDTLLADASESQTDPAQLDEPMASSKTVEQQPVEPVEPLTSDPAEGSHETESNGTEPDGQSGDGDGGLVDEVVGDVVVTAPVNAPVTASCNNVSVLSDESSADCAGADQDNGQGAASGSTLRTWMGLPEQPYGFVKAMLAKYDKH